MDFEEWAEGEIATMLEGQLTMRPGAHQSLFKYVTLDSDRSWDLLTETLNSFSLNGSTPRHLNDPFELSPSLSDDLSALAVADIDRLEGKKLLEALLDDSVEKASIDPLRADNLRKIARLRIDQNAKYARIISFCRRLDSPLLWSHYANKYEGACLQFLGRAFPRIGIQLGFVDYSPERPIYPLSLALRLEQAIKTRQYNRSYKLLKAESDKITYFTKSQEWAYEQEARIVYNANKSETITFNPIGLVSIVIGPRMAAKSQERLKSIVRSSKLPDLQIRNSNLSKTSFSVEFE